MTYTEIKGKGTSDNSPSLKFIKPTGTKKVKSNPAAFDKDEQPEKATEESDEHAEITVD